MLDFEMVSTAEKGGLKPLRRLGSSKWLKKRLEALGVGQEGQQAPRESAFCKAPDAAAGVNTPAARGKTASLLPTACKEKASVETPPTTAGTEGQMESDCDLALQSSPWQGFFSDSLWANSEDLLAPEGVITPRSLQQAGKSEGAWPDRPATTGQLPEATRKPPALNLQDVYRQSQKPRSPAIKQPASRPPAERGGRSAIIQAKRGERVWQSIVC
mmetsp:Transcript_67098/g.119171  ORF Transcript_67098/g.119171 Transcript_67098/m.119171 type:complete len:215 (-) Transcript_67098:9-653(-)